MNKNMSDQCDSAASSSASSAELLADSRKQREMLENELRRVRGQLEASHKVSVEREVVQLGEKRVAALPLSSALIPLEYSLE